ncbi:hypothetical protein LCGC14_1124140 [marine sediment metagenome]|uniref:DUF1318 domain-containing protein n=1 Tax=marine sediment metagenome TaxID=412755 RepID=A0A0F9M7W5_9ZZZZ|nr:DUF1318 domain-containing protein [Methylophaga sp.]
MALFKWLTSSVTGLMLVSCVTINIYFPEAAAEKAADKIIGDVWGEEAKPSAVPAPSEQSKPLSALPANSTNIPVAMSVLNWLISPAAADANLNINSAAVTSIQNRMKTRHESLKAYYGNGAVGLTENGLITIRDAKAVSLKDRNTVNGLVADENKDRAALYAEIARANNHPEWQADIQATFAERWISNAASGWWYQKNGQWQQK